VRGGADAVVDGELVPKDAPHAGADWVPLGPTQVTVGTASGRPPVTGRVRGLAVGAGGQRAYAASANGGVWMTRDGGAHWQPLDPWRDTPNAGLVAGGGGLAIGSLAARFGASEDDDVVFAGCGEPGGWSGDGVRRFARAGGAGPPVWTSEAITVTNHRTWRVVVPPPGAPGGADRAWLCSSDGLFERPLTAPFDTWARVAMPAAPAALALNAVGDAALILDADGATEFLYVAVNSTAIVRFRLVAGSAVGQAGVVCTGVGDAMTAADRARLGRITLAASEDGRARVYALLAVRRGSKRSRLLRFAHATAGTPRFRLVNGVPGSLWWQDGSDQGHYDVAVAIVPQAVPAPASPTDEVIVCGSYRDVEGVYQANVHRCRVAGTAASPTANATYIGHGAHPDVHYAAYPRRADGTLDAGDLWLGTDGGTFRSRTGVENGRFAPAHGGMGVLQLNFIADHPTVPALLLGGSQDNGLVVYSGELTWRQREWTGDAGGVALDAVQQRWMWQYVNGALRADRPPGTGLPAPHVVFPTTTVASRRKAESDNTNFYAPLRTVVTPAPPAQTRVAFGSHRIWTSDDWGAHWRSWPSGTNPAATGNGSRVNQLDGNRVAALAWANPSVLLVATSSAVYRLRGIGAAPGQHDVLARDSADARSLKRPGEAANVAPRAFATQSATGGTPADLPDFFRPTAIAPADNAGTTVYLGLGEGSSPEPVWFLPAGATSWLACLLGAFLGGATDVHALLVDPANPTDIYVGTDVGVYRGVRNDGVNPPTWRWEDFSFGLPEASVSDLALFAPPGSPVRLLRAATYGRGVWEIDLEKAAGRDLIPGREPEVFLRVSSTDDGRRIPGVTRSPDPLDATLPAPAPAGIAASPDIAVVRGRARAVRPWPGSVTGAARAADRQAWRIAAATWGRALTPSTATFATADRQAWQAIQRERAIPVTSSLNERTWRTTFAGLDRDPDHVGFVERYGRELGPSRRQAADRGPNRVLVQVRTRGPDVVPAPATTVYLLFQVVAPVVPVPPLPAAPAPPHPGVTLPQLPDEWRRKIRDDDRAGLAEAGWALAGPVSAADVDPESPTIVGLDVDLSGRAVGDLVALVAIVRSANDLLATAPATRDVATVVTTENRVALQVVEVRDPAT